MSPASKPPIVLHPGTMAARALEELAPAKINLCLHILGRRSDGYHELESLVAFASAPAADQVTLEPGEPLRLEIDGPGAGALAGETANLVQRAAEAAKRACPPLTLGTFRLAKRLPIAAGLGGGSADAAAALRLIRRANPQHAAEVDWMGIAASIGADVPVCLASRASLMTGRGEIVEPVAALPPVWAVLANPGVPLATGPVFKALGAPPYDATRPRDVFRPSLATPDDLIGALAMRPNDLEASAARLCPAIIEVRSALLQLDGVRLARMSGSGPTCFALFATPDVAQAGARALRRDHPGWWVEAARLG